MSKGNSGFGKSFFSPRITFVVFALLCQGAVADTYRVGPGEEYEKVSGITGKLEAGDVVEITGDITDKLTLTAHGTYDSPITIRGVARVEEGRIVRPRLIGDRVGAAEAVITCRGNYNTIEGLDIQVSPGGLVTDSACILIGADGDLVRNCRMSWSWYGLMTDGGSSGDVTVEFCDFDSVYRPLGFKYWATTGRQIACATVQHCYIHDCTGGYTMLRSEYPRTVVRYNWFENASNKAMSLVGPSFNEGRQEPDVAHLWPAHADIVGNVFFHGISPDGTHAILTIGAEPPSCPKGPQGDFNIAHNLFVRTENGWDAELSSHILMLPNVDNVKLYNNVFLDYASVASSVYNTAWLRDSLGGTAEEEFTARRNGNPYAVITGSHNWISEGAGGVAEELDSSVQATNPRMVSLLEKDYRPRPDSPLASGGLADLPKGRIIDLVAEYEPVRGIPVDLAPTARVKADPPSIGPFEPAGESEYLEGTDEATEMVLGLRKAGARFPWELEFGQARQKVLMYLAKGRKEEALACARMQFILSPPTEMALGAAIDSVQEALQALDGDSVRADVFELYAKHGPDGLDGKPGTGDDLDDPLKDVPLDIFAKEEGYYEKIDRAIEGRLTFSSESNAKVGFYQTERAFARLNGAAFNDAALILLETLEGLVTLSESASRALDGHAEFPRIQYQIDGVKLGLAAYYKSVKGTTKGIDEFTNACVNYCVYGPMGPDRKFGTGDDLEPPL